MAEQKPASQLSEIEQLRFDAAKAKVESHNAQYAALVANKTALQNSIQLAQQNITLTETRLAELLSRAEALQKSFNTTVEEIKAAHPDLDLDSTSGFFYAKPQDVKEQAPAKRAKKAAAPSTEQIQ